MISKTHRLRSLTTGLLYTTGILCLTTNFYGRFDLVATLFGLVALVMGYLVLRATRGPLIAAAVTSAFGLALGVAGFLGLAGQGYVPVIYPVYFIVMNPVIAIACLYLLTRMRPRRERVRAE